MDSSVTQPTLCEYHNNNVGVCILANSNYLCLPMSLFASFTLPFARLPTLLSIFFLLPLPSAMPLLLCVGHRANIIPLSALQAACVDPSILQALDTWQLVRCHIRLESGGHHHHVHHHVHNHVHNHIHHHVHNHVHHHAHHHYHGGVCDKGASSLVYAFVEARLSQYFHRSDLMRGGLSEERTRDLIRYTRSMMHNPQLSDCRDAHIHRTCMFAA
jgi:hypothetical protein